MNLIEDEQVYTLASTTSEQDLLVVAPGENQTRWFSSLYWHCTNLTQNTTFRIYFWDENANVWNLLDGAGGIGGTISWVALTSGKALRFLLSAVLTYGSKIKLTAQSAVAEGADRDVTISVGYLAD